MKGKGKLIAYWIFTGLVAFAIGAGGLMQAIKNPQNVQGMQALGYPVHFIVELGVWKVLGALTIVVPGFKLVKEWAYAGIFFDLTGAAVTAAANGSEAFHILAPIALMGMLVASWALRPESRRLARVAAASPTAPVSKPSLAA